MMKLGLCLVFALAIQISSISSLKATSSYLKSEDLQRFQKVFIDGLNSNDLQSIYYSSLNIQTQDPKDKETICKALQTAHSESKLNDFEKNFYLVSAHKTMKCTNKLPQEVLDKVAACLSKDAATTQEVFFNVFASKSMGVTISPTIADKINKNLQTILKKDEGLASQGYALCTATELGNKSPFTSLVDKFSDIVQQADEVDGKFLQFEGGLAITALILNCGCKVFKANQKQIPINEEQFLKFANYLLTRKSVQTPKGAHVLIEAIKTISEEKKVGPISIEVLGAGQLSPESQDLTVRITDLMGKTVAPALASVSGKILDDKDKVVKDKVSFVAKSSDKTTFAADLKPLKLVRGTYKVQISADSYQQNLKFNVLGNVKVNSMEISIGDTDASTSMKTFPLSHPNKLGEILKGDMTQKLALKFQLHDQATAKPITVHQAFVRFHCEKGSEIVYIAEADTSKTYKVELDIGSKANDFDYRSGKYGIDLIVGDALLANSFQWNLGSIEIKYGADSKTDAVKEARSKLPEIIHQFRQPDSRPPIFVSNVFTAFCLAPLALLFIFWGKLGINLSNFHLSLSAIGFHLGFGAILGLFALFWLQLNMFQTIRLLIPIAVFTFLAGNRLLRNIAGRKS